MQIRASAVEKCGDFRGAIANATDNSRVPNQPRQSCSGRVTAAHFEAVAAGILEKHRVVAGTVFGAQLRALDVACARALQDRAKRVDRFAAVAPEGDPRLVRHVLAVLSEIDALGPRMIADRIVADVVLADETRRETQRRQNRAVEFIRLREIADAQVNVVEQSHAHRSPTFLLRATRARYSLIRLKLLINFLEGPFSETPVFGYRQPRFFFGWYQTFGAAFRATFFDHHVEHPAAGIPELHDRKI